MPPHPAIVLYISQTTSDHVICLKGLQCYLDQHQLHWPVTYITSLQDYIATDQTWGVALKPEWRHEFFDVIPPERCIAAFDRATSDLPGACRFDFAAMGALAANYLCNQGYRHLSLIDTEQGTRQEQRQAFMHTCAQRGVLAGSFYLQGQEYETDLIDYLKDCGPRLAVHCYTDGQAEWLLRLCNKAKLKVPDDLAILGTNNQWSRCLRQQPHLSSIALPWKLIGEAIGSNLHHRILGSGPPDPVILPGYRVIERQSTIATPTNDPLVRKAQTWLQKHLHSKQPLAEAARAVGCAEPTLAKHFRRQVHTSVKATLDQMRCKKAQQLLADTDMPITIIGKRCGYASATAFGIAFKRMMGTSPGRWRDMIR